MKSTEHVDSPKIDYTFRSLSGIYTREWVVKGLLAVCSLLSIFVTLAIIYVLFFEASRFFAADEVTFYDFITGAKCCLLYTSPSPRDQRGSRMPSSA